MSFTRDVNLAFIRGDFNTQERSMEFASELERQRNKLFKALGDLSFIVGLSLNHGNRYDIQEALKASYDKAQAAITKVKEAA